MHSTELAIISALYINGTVYGFAGDAKALGHSFTLDVANGNTTFITNVDPAAGLIFGPAPVPEPTSLALAGFGIAVTVFWNRRCGMFQHLKVVPITAAGKRASKEEPLPRGPTRKRHAHARSRRSRRGRHG